MRNNIQRLSGALKDSLADFRCPSCGYEISHGWEESDNFNFLYKHIEKVKSASTREEVERITYKTHSAFDGQRPSYIEVYLTCGGEWEDEDGDTTYCDESLHIKLAIADVETI